MPFASRVSRPAPFCTTTFTSQPSDSSRFSWAITPDE